MEAESHINFYHVLYNLEVFVVAASYKFSVFQISHFLKLNNKLAVSKLLTNTKDLSRKCTSGNSWGSSFNPSQPGGMTYVFYFLT